MCLPTIPIKRGRHIGLPLHAAGPGRVKLLPSACVGVVERKLCGVQTETRGRVCGQSVQFVADDWMTEMGAVNTKLVGAARDGFEFDEGIGGMAFQHAQPRLRVAARLHDTPKRRRFVTANGRVNEHFVVGNDAMNQRKIAFGDAVFLPMARENAQGALRFGDGEQARSVTVKPVHQAGADEGGVRGLV